MIYFAYGSNLLAPWLRRPGRCPSASALGPARLANHRLVWDKPGADGSAKLNILADESAEVWGTLYEAADTDRPALRASEPGYQEYPVLVEHRSSTIGAVTFRWPGAGACPPPPFDWYVDIVMEGARRQGLPAWWIDRLAVDCRRDPDHDRRSRCLAFLSRQ
ncbi:MAG: gamma-glutamylcyclotransferase family protein [Acidimicrobiia bacterium]